MGMELFLSEYPAFKEAKSENDECYRLYVNSKTYLYSTFEQAVLAAQEYMQGSPELRIEILVETDGADFWAYEYQSNRWVPS